MRLPYFAVAAALLSCSLAAHATLLGDSVNATYAYPDSGTVFANLGNFTVPGGSSVPDGRGGTLGTFQILPTQIVITSTEDQSFNVSSFNGFEFTVLGTDPMISGVTLDALSTFPGAMVTFTSNTVNVNFSGLTATNGQTAIFDLSFAAPVAATPEPSSIALMGSGLLGVAGVMRRRFVRS